MNNFLISGLSDNLENFSAWLRLIWTLDTDPKYTRVFFNLISGEYSLSEYPESDPFSEDYMGFISDCYYDHPVWPIAYELGWFMEDLVLTIRLWYRIIFFRGGENYTDLLYYYLGHTRCAYIDDDEGSLSHQFMYWDSIWWCDEYFI